MFVRFQENQVNYCYNIMVGVVILPFRGKCILFLFYYRYFDGELDKIQKNQKDSVEVIPPLILLFSMLFIV